MIVTIVVGKIKWGWLEKAYDNLKANYSGVLDEDDIAVAVNNDVAFQDTEKEYKLGKDFYYDRICQQPKRNQTISC